MADLIERDALKKHVCDMCDDGQRECKGDESCAILCWINDMPAVNRWISVEDALPEIKEFNISDTVLCYCDSGALAIARLEANGFGQLGFNCEKDDEYHHSVGKVLYWMPIPEIPEPHEKECDDDVEEEAKP